MQNKLILKYTQMKADISQDVIEGLADPLLLEKDKEVLASVNDTMNLVFNMIIHDLKSLKM